MIGMIRGAVQSSGDLESPSARESIILKPLLNSPAWPGVQRLHGRVGAPSFGIQQEIASVEWNDGGAAS
jgi:hypothetical protein